jgi:hypothetical protein
LLLCVFEATNKKFELKTWHYKKYIQRTQIQTLES